MSSEIRLWKIEDDSPRPIDQSTLNLEARLEKWLRQDIGMVNDNLLVIGQQVSTAYGGIIDLLAIDSVGNLVILELKRDRTSRDIVAQTLDYASWVKGLGHRQVEEIAADFLEDGMTLEQAFAEKFNAGLPEVVNESHRMYIVASSLDPATERIVEYLSETYDVDINVATFVYFKTPEGEELLGRSFLLDEQEVQRRSQSRNAPTRRRRNATLQELRKLAQEKGTLALFDRACDELRPLCNRSATSQSTVSMQVRIRGGYPTALSIVPEWSSFEVGLVMRLRDDVITQHFNVPESRLREVCGESVESIPGVDPTWLWSGERLFDDEKLGNFIGLLKNANAQES